MLRDARCCFCSGTARQRYSGWAASVATPKHFAGYGVPVGGHNGQPSALGQRELFSAHLEPFRMGVNASVKTLMTSYNAIDGIPATAHRYYRRMYW